MTSIDQARIGAEGYDMVWQAMADLSVAALSCDHTVISLSLGDLARKTSAGAGTCPATPTTTLRIASPKTQAAEAMTDYMRRAC